MGEVHFGVVDPESLKIREFRKTLKHSESGDILSLLSTFLGEDRERLTKIVVCTGPGSFTGTRVGVSLSQGIAFGLNIPLVPLPTGDIPDDLTTIITLPAVKNFSVQYNRPAL